MTISIIIVNFKNPPLLRLALQSLSRVLKPDLPAEVIVVDSQSSPETANVVAEDCASLFQSLRYVPFKENTGYTRGVNEGLRRAAGDFMLVINPDIIMLPGALESTLDYMATHPQIGMVGPGLLNFDDSHQSSCFRFYTPLIMLARRLAIPGTRNLLRSFLLANQVFHGPTEVDWVMGSALLVSRTALERVGLMDEQFFLYMSEVDWAWRFWENGYKVVYLPTVQVYHYHQRQSKGRFALLDVFTRRETRWHITDAIRYFLKHGTNGQRPESQRPAQSALNNI